MAIKIKFDTNHNAEFPTFALALKNGRRLGNIPAKNVTFNGKMKDFSEIFFNVYKEDNGVEYALWDKIKDFKLLFCPEWNAFFEMTVEVNEEDDLVKNVIAKSLGEAELSNIRIYETEINTEADIARDDYVATTLYDADNPEASLLNRILEKAPHYNITHVDASIANIQRIFSFDDTSIYDALQEISEEINCYFKLEACLDENGNIERNIYAYDLESYCHDCGTRNEFTGFCPECGSANCTHGYGQDTTILASSRNLANDIVCATDVDAYKNCFRLSAGDDLMTATIANCNPNGSNYIWYISEDMKEDMSDALVEKLAEYDAEYDYYYNNYVADISSDVVSNYNSLVEKYSEYSEDILPSPTNITGFPQLIEQYYNAIDFQLYLESGLMPDSSMQDTNAETEAKKITNDNLEFIAVTNAEIVSVATASSAALSLAKTIVDSRYQVKVDAGVIDGGNWIGSFKITNYSDEEDTAVSNSISLPITDDYESFVRQKIDKTLSSSSSYVTNISEMFKLDIEQFKEEIKKYALNRLVSFQDSCQACLNVLIEQGIADKQAWSDNENDLYAKLYIPYYNKLSALQEEIKLRESEISIICGVYDSEHRLVSDGFQTVLIAERNAIQNRLDYESFMGEDLWLELASYRREEPYKNENYISDGLDNSELVKNAMDFVKDAKKEISKIATLKHTITTSLKNLLVLKEFEPIVEHFELGNWIRLKVDGKIYRLRLISYKIDYDNLENIEVEFSDAAIVSNTIDKTRKIISKAASMASTYATVTHQAKLGKQGNDKVANIVSNGISVSETKIADAVTNENMSWDPNGFMLKKYDDIEEDYDACQMKIYNSTISLTDNNWESVKTAVGGYYFTDPQSGELKYVYGVNAEVLIGKLILGEQLGIYNESGSLSFDDRGFLISNGTNSFKVDPNSEILLSISNGIENVFYIDNNGRLYINAEGSNIDLTSNTAVTDLFSLVTSVDLELSDEIDRSIAFDEKLSKKISEESIRAISAENEEKQRATDAENQLSRAISTEKQRATNVEDSLADRITAIEQQLSA